MRSSWTMMKQAHFVRAIGNDDKASSWWGLTNVDYVVQGHVHGDEAHEQRWSKLRIDCKLIESEPCKRHRGSGSSRTIQRTKAHDRMWCELVLVDHSSWNRWSSWATRKQACDVHRQWGSKLVICLDNWTHLVQSHLHANIFFKLMIDCELFCLCHVHIKLMISDDAHEQRYDGELIS